MKLEYYFAEFFTDKIIREKYFPDFSYHGTMIEVGGGTPSYLSMSKHFKMNGWRCIIIEPNPTLAEMHRKAGNEIYEFACSEEDKDDVNFQIVHISDDYYSDSTITDQSFSSISIKQSYLDLVKANINKLPIVNVKVKTRKLDTILNDIKPESIDFISIDVEGWELEVMNGFSSLQTYKPKVVVLENWLSQPEYTSYMEKLGYKFDGQVNYNYMYSPK